MRTSDAPFALQVQADGKHVGEWTFQPSGSGWQEATFRIPAKSVRSKSLRVRLSPSEEAPLQTHSLPLLVCPAQLIEGSAQQPIGLARMQHLQERRVNQESLWLSDQFGQDCAAQGLQARHG